MSIYKTPGVYIEEIAKFPPSVAAVETAIPAFIGKTQTSTDTNGDPLNGIPKRIVSLLEYEQYFGTVDDSEFEVTVDTEGNVTFTANPTNPPSNPPKDMLYYCMQLFFANGGGPCYIVSIDPNDSANYTAALDTLAGHDEPTLYVFPGATELSGGAADHKTVLEKSLTQCQELQDRFTIADVVMTDATEYDEDDITNFRLVTGGTDQLKYGAAYYPYLKTSINFKTSDDKIKVKYPDGNGGETPGDLNGIKETQSAYYNAVKAFIQANTKVILPPSAAIAGVYARTDANRGVWKAPANAGLALVTQPTINISNSQNGSLNIDASGKSINAIRAFHGKGVLVWGARTLAGNDNEWRYIPVRRLFNFAEESIKKAIEHFVFEPNDANTWVKVRTMIENFLTLLWRDGALAGAKPEDAFYVNVGLNQTMSAQDILEGRMIVEVGMAAVRPAEFIVLQFSHKMQES